MAEGSVAGLQSDDDSIPGRRFNVAVFYFHKKYILSEQKVEEIAKEIKERKKA